MPTTDKRPLKVFLCHASTDKPKVRELYRYLKKRGINPWFDEEDLVGGQDWQVEIPKALATSDAIIICLTKNSVDKEGYIQKEIKFALDKALEMPEGRIFLIPIKFEECEVPFTLSRYQWVDLTVESGYAKMMKALKFRASQLERSTVELPKPPVVIQDEKPSFEKNEQKMIEKALREEAERETIEKANLEKRAREAAEHTEQERKEKELHKKRAREASEKANFGIEKSALEKNENKPRVVKPKTNNQVLYWFGGFVVFVLGIIFLSSLNTPPSSSGPTPESTQAKVIFTSTYIETIEPSATLTSKPTLPPTITLTPTPLPTEIIDANGVTMRLVSEGNFTMGIDDSSTYPAHQVYLNPFYMDIYEVTNAAYKVCVDEGGCTPPQKTISRIRSSYYGNSQFDNYPVIYVDWNQAKTYCEWRDARLPSEAEWEKAARGENTATYPWGEELPDCSLANVTKFKKTFINPNLYYENWSSCGGDTVQVGSYKRGVSTYGLYDMIGNVEEWVADWFDSNYYFDSPSNNPSGPNSGEYRVIRGGSLYSYDGVTSMQRGIAMPNDAQSDVGFRCVRD